MTRFNVVWLDGDGFAWYAETFNHTGFEGAKRFQANRLTRKVIDPKTSGFFLAYADSDFIRNHTVGDNKYGKKTEIISLDEALASYPHLQR